jgi:hypothetical protein
VAQYHRPKIRRFASAATRTRREVQDTLGTSGLIDAVWAYHRFIAEGLESAKANERTPAQVA